MYCVAQMFLVRTVSIASQWVDKDKTDDRLTLNLTEVTPFIVIINTQFDETRLIKDVTANFLVDSLGNACSRGSVVRRP